MIAAEDNNAASLFQVSED